MRSQSFRVRPAWAVALVCGAVSLGGCKKQEATPKAEAGPAAAGQASAAAPVDAGTVAVVADTRTPFLFKDVKLARTEEGVKLTYTLVNQGPKRARAISCLGVYDKDGYELADLTLGPISLKGGESDGFEDAASVDSSLWAEARTVRLYAAPSCFDATSASVISQVSHLDLTGKPAPAGAPAPKAVGTLEEGVIAFELTEVSLRQDDPSSLPSLVFTVKNTSAARASASVCLRFYEHASDVGHIDEDSSSAFNLGPGASKTVTYALTLDDDKHLDSTTVLKAYASSYGCVSSARTAVSNVVEFPKPQGIRSPPTEAEPEDADEPTMDVEEPTEGVEPTAGSDDVEVDDP